MVRFLILDVTLDFVQIGITHRKYAVSGLPCKAWISLGDTFRPFGSFRLNHFNELANLLCSRQPNEQMDMIDVSAYDRDNAPSLFNVMSQHAKHLVTKFRFFKKRITVLRRKHDVQPNLCVRLRHTNLNSDLSK